MICKIIQKQHENRIGGRISRETVFGSSILQSKITAGVSKSDGRMRKGMDSSIEVCLNE
jgi:hypothetical protein